MDRDRAVAAATALGWLLFGAWLAWGGSMAEEVLGDDGLYGSPHPSTPHAIGGVVLAARLLRTPAGAIWIGLLLAGSLPYLAGARRELRMALSACVWLIAGSMSAAFVLAIHDPRDPSSGLCALVAGMGVLGYACVWCAIATELISAPRCDSMARETVLCLVVAAPIGCTLTFVAGALAVLVAPARPPFLLVPMWVAMAGGAFAIALLAVVAIRAQRARTRAPTP